MNDVATVSPRSLISLRSAGERLAMALPRATAQHTGGYRSPFKGRGMEFEESRRYQAGDDIRNMDWRVTARTGEPHTKLFREERERPVLFGVDFRQSMFFATRGVFKTVMACRLAALLAWRSNHQGDRVGGVLWSGTSHREMRPKRGARGVLALISTLCDFGAGPAPEKGTADSSLESMAARLRRVAHPGSQVFVLSDFRGFTQHARDLLSHTARHCDLVFILIHDPIEVELPPPGRYLIRHHDTELMIDTRPGDHRQAYSAQFQARSEAVQNFCRKTSTRFLHCPTVADPATVLRTRLSH